MKAKAIAVGRDLDRLFGLGADGTITDPQLLEVFVEGKDESASLAFEVIVEAPWADGSAAAAGRSWVTSMRPRMHFKRPSSCWLAKREPSGRASFCQTGSMALRAGSRERRNRAGTSTRNREFALAPEAAVDDRAQDGLETEVNRIVHEEIDRLPRAYRCAVVVCYLQGKSQAQAAAQLELTETTIRGRLARARKLLGRRLTVRGVAPATLLIVLESLNADAGMVPLASVRRRARRF